MKHNNDIQILLVDDVSENLQVLGNILNKEGYNTNFAINGYQALKIIPELLPDLILLDINMPEINGYEVCRQIKSNPATSHIPIIFLTAYTELEDIVKGFEMGAVDYVIKPFNSSELLARVKVQLDLKIANEIIVEQNKHLHEKNIQLNELNATKDKLFSIIGHDLRNPFNSIIGFSSLLLENIDNYDSERIKRIVGLINSSAENTINLLENLLEWALVQLDQIKFVPEEFNLHAIATDCFILLKNLADVKHIEIVNKIPENMTLFADKEMIKTIIRNLLTNAIKYTSSGTITLTGILKHDHVIIGVSDTGIGMDKKTVQALFKVGETHSTKGTQGEGGTGFGLLLCKGFIEKHGGEIWVDSEKNHGSQFKFIIPIKN